MSDYAAFTITPDGSVWAQTFIGEKLCGMVLVTPHKPMTLPPIDWDEKDHGGCGMEWSGS